MKTLFLTAFLALTMVSCNNKAKETETNATEGTESTSQLFACPMHPEITGKKGEKCSKCGMELTEPVAQGQGGEEQPGQGGYPHNPHLAQVVREVGVVVVGALFVLGGEGNVVLVLIAETDAEERIGPELLVGRPALGGQDDGLPRARAGDLRALRREIVQVAVVAFHGDGVHAAQIAHGAADVLHAARLRGGRSGGRGG